MQNNNAEVRKFVRSGNGKLDSNNLFKFSFASPYVSPPPPQKKKKTKMVMHMLHPLKAK